MKRYIITWQKFTRFVELEHADFCQQEIKEFETVEELKKYIIENEMHSWTAEKRLKHAYEIIGEEIKL